MSKSKSNSDNKKKETKAASEEEKVTEKEAEAIEEKDPAEDSAEEKTAEKPEEEKTEAAEEPEEEKQEEIDEEKVPEKQKNDSATAVKEANDKYLRLMAEYDNYRKRSQKERDALYGDIKADVVTKFLPVYDNLVRALEQTTEDEAYRKGVEMIMSQFEKTLETLGVSEIESIGETFDPNLHNAVMHVDDDTKGENEIVEVFQKGFKLGDKVIRFAMVKVAN